MKGQELKRLREKIDTLNMRILKDLNERAILVEKIGRVKIRQGVEPFDPVRESEMLERLIEANAGPFPDDVIRNLFKEIFRASLYFIKEEGKEALLVSRKHKSHDTQVKVRSLVIGAGTPVVMAGPCSVESLEQIERIAAHIASLGVPILRGGAFKPRTSPYAFQGLGIKGLKIMKEVAERHRLLVISEILDPRHLEGALPYIDIVQIGARNMYNYELLKEVGRARVPVMLKRGMMATIEEFLLSAEYIHSQGNSDIILCERGIRTFETWTRNTLDISAVPILKKESHLPVIVDISHSTGRRDIALPVAKAALACGADGIMVEVHGNPSVALSDNQQQLNLEEFTGFIEGLALRRRTRRSAR